MRRALSKQWRRLSVIAIAWSTVARQAAAVRKGMWHLTLQRFYRSLRRAFALWCRRRPGCGMHAVSAVLRAHRDRRVLRHVLKVLKRLVFEERAAREIYDLGPLDDSHSPTKR